MAPLRVHRPHVELAHDGDLGGREAGRPVHAGRAAQRRGIEVASAWVTDLAVEHAVVGVARRDHGAVQEK